MRARINIWGQVTSKVSTELKKIAKFYNEYQIINFSDQNELKSKKKALTKQMEELERCFASPELNEYLRGL